ncbi:hypothetical protein A1351_12235 [Methylosinus sp. R-45379]|uniref:hypothetical protein n=1 Tax=Methylosinus sp. R-45379 TaxID=980563 RepID=UPI0007C9462B|nr:hypothetical protein [Methylosinus sp. R-45379]OAI28175.1 hypothetical protein A1351_12235 [Methylosinus sp. R-45379]
MENLSTTGSEIRDAATAAAFDLDVFDHAAARRDGWVISDCGSYRDGAPRIELQKFDDPEQGPPKFRDDREAWAHVVARARSGSALHIRALDLVDRRERSAIEAAFGPW